MKSAVRWRLAPFWAGVLPALLAVGLLAPPAAQAGCRHDTVSTLTARGDSVLTDLDILADVPQGPADGAPRMPSPCAGLSCSSRDPMPPPIPAPPGSRSELWGCLAGLVPLPDPHSFALAADRGPVRPVHRSAPPDRPPRPLS